MHLRAIASPSFYGSDKHGKLKNIYVLCVSKKENVIPGSRGFAICQGDYSEVAIHSFVYVFGELHRVDVVNMFTVSV